LGQAGKWFAPYYLDIGFGESEATVQAMAGVGYSFGWGDVVAALPRLQLQVRGPIEDLSFSGPLVASGPSLPGESGTPGPSSAFFRSIANAGRWPSTSVAGEIGMSASLVASVVLAAPGAAHATARIRPTPTDPRQDTITVTMGMVAMTALVLGLVRHRPRAPSTARTPA
jgi:hypothetical protein